MANRGERYGSKIAYDQLWKGPIESSRYVTDRVWLIIFSIFVAVYTAIAVYGIAAGNIDKLTNPMDHAGRSCGIDPEVRNQSYLMVINLRSCIQKQGEPCTSPTVCLSECPKRNFHYLNHSFPDLKENLICTTDVNVASISTIDQIEILIKEEKCTKWYLDSMSENKRCIAKQVWEGYENITITKPELVNATKIFKNERGYLQETYDDISIGLSPALVATICGGVMAFAYVALLRWCAVPFFYGAVIWFCALTGYGIFKTGIKFAQNEHDSIALAAFLCLIGLVLLTIVLLICFRKKIKVALELVKESSKAVIQLSSTFIFPIIPWILYAFIFISTLYVFLSLSTITMPKYAIENLDVNNTEKCTCKNSTGSTFQVNETCNPIIFKKECTTALGQPCQLLNCIQKTKENPNYLSILYAINFFGLYWFLCFISGFNYMVLGGTYATWYWTYNKNNVGNYALIQNASKTIRYHLGTIALGSLILTVVRMINKFLEAIQNRLKDRNSGWAMALTCLFQCLFELLESFLSFISYNAYIMCAVHGKSFCNSAKDAFSLLMRNIVNIIVVDEVVDYIFEIGKLMITSIAVVGVETYYIYGEEMDAFDTKPVVASIITAIGTYVICSVLFSIQTLAVKTIFLCFLEDSERNDGSEDRPYFMSDKLKRLLYK